MFISSENSVRVLSAIAGIVDEPTIVGHWVIVAEVTMEDGSSNLLTAHSDEIPFWLETGMLQSRLDEIALGNYDLGEEI